MGLSSLFCLNKIGVSMFSKNIWLTSYESKLYHLAVLHIKKLFILLFSRDVFNYIIFLNLYEFKKIKFFIKTKGLISPTTINYFKFYLIKIAKINYIVMLFYKIKNILKIKVRSKLIIYNYKVNYKYKII